MCAAQNNVKTDGNIGFFANLEVQHRNMNALENLLSTIDNVRVIPADRYIPVDLSPGNPDLQKIGNNADDFEQYIEELLSAKNADAAFGGYNEKRGIYRRSIIFNDEGSPERDIHIGIDLWIKAKTPVFAALDGTVHSFDYNTGTGNYGPTIILEHQISGVIFYTLYGHLSLESIENLEVGDVFKQGQPIGSLGDASVNGDYAPHLHFQIIRDLEGNSGDYPGVCNQSDLDHYLSNCPDPDLLLKLKRQK